MSDTFTCADCRETFSKAWSDEEALAEAAVNGFTDDLVVICDDCHRSLMEESETP